MLVPGPDCPTLTRCPAEEMHIFIWPSVAAGWSGGVRRPRQRYLPALHPIPAGRRALGVQCNPRKEQVGIREAEHGVQSAQPPCRHPTARSSVMVAPAVLDDIDLEASVYARGLHGAASTM